MDKFKALSLVLLGMVIGLGYALACGSGDNEEEATMPVIPGVGLAMAQSGCAQYELRRFGDVTSSEAAAGYAIEPGWTPFGGGDNGPWAARCAQ